jgi:hypothetical protein
MLLADPCFPFLCLQDETVPEYVLEEWQPNQPAAQSPSSSSSPAQWDHSHSHAGPKGLHAWPSSDPGHQACCPPRLHTMPVGEWSKPPILLS